MTIEPGIYLHYKGGLYFVEGTEIDTSSGTGPRTMVRYRGSRGECYTRNIREFTETVGCVYQGKSTLEPRYRRIDDDLILSLKKLVGTKA